MPTLYPRLGTKPSASGNSPLVSPLVASSATPTTFSPSLSLPTTVKSFRDRVTARSSYGTPSETASSPSRIRVTRNGCLAFGLARTPRTRSLLALDGTSSLRYVRDILRRDLDLVTGCFAIYKYLLLQSLRAMRQTSHQCTDDSLEHNLFGR